MYYFNFLNLGGKDITYSFWTKFSNSGYSDIAPPLPSNYLFLPPSGKFMNQLPFYSFKHACYIFVKHIFILVAYEKKNGT